MLFASDVMHCEGCVLGKAPLNIVGARDDPDESSGLANSID